MKATNNTNIIFWGTPDITLPYLEKLEHAGYNLKAIITLPDRPIGRKQILTSPAPKTWANERNIPVFQPEKLDQDFSEEIKKINPDISIVVAYGKIIPESIINIPSFGTLNVHYSLLPKWRGATPVESTILHGDQSAGVSIQQMVYKLDAGDTFTEKEIKLQGNEFREDLRQLLSETGSDLLVESLPGILDKTMMLKPQDESLVTRAKILSKEDGLITLDENPEKLWQKWRAYFPWPGLFFFDKDGKRIKITEARFENKTFIIEKVVPEGKKETTWEEFKKK